MSLIINAQDTQGLDVNAVTAKIQAVIDRLAENGGGQLTLQAGQYQVSSLTKP